MYYQKDTIEVGCAQSIRLCQNNVCTIKKDTIEVLCALSKRLCQNNVCTIKKDTIEVMCAQSKRLSQNNVCTIRKKDHRRCIGLYAGSMPILYINAAFS